MSAAVQQDGSRASLASERRLCLARLVISLNGGEIREIPITQERLKLGRRPFNNILLEDGSVSGEHALLQTSQGRSVIHDLSSRNGIAVNGEMIEQRLLEAGDLIQIGAYIIQYKVEHIEGSQKEISNAHRLASTQSSAASVMPLNGADMGNATPLLRSVNSIGDPGVAVAVIAKRSNGYFITHLEGAAYPMVNGDSIGLNARPLSHNDVIELSGLTFKFSCR
jgi:FHA domain